MAAFRDTATAEVSVDRAISVAGIDVGASKSATVIVGRTGTLSVAEIAGSEMVVDASLNFTVELPATFTPSTKARLALGSVDFGGWQSELKVDATRLGTPQLDTVYRVAEFDSNTRSDWLTKEGIYAPAGYAVGEVVNAPTYCGFTLLKIVAVPVAETGLTYSGAEQTVTLSGDPATYAATGTTGTNVGAYEARVTPTDGYCWEDFTTEEKAVAWSIAPKTLTYVRTEISFDGTNWATFDPSTPTNVGYYANTPHYRAVYSGWNAGDGPSVDIDGICTGYAQGDEPASVGRMPPWHGTKQDYVPKDYATVANGTPTVVPAGYSAPAFNNFTNGIVKVCPIVFTWNSAEPGNWGDAANWVPNFTTPGCADLPNTKYDTVSFSDMTAVVNVDGTYGFGRYCDTASSFVTIQGQAPNRVTQFVSQTIDTPGAGAPMPMIICGTLVVKDLGGTGHSPFKAMRWICEDGNSASLVMEGLGEHCATEGDVWAANGGKRTYVMKNCQFSFEYALSKPNVTWASWGGAYAKILMTDSIVSSSSAKAIEGVGRNPSGEIRLTNSTWTAAYFRPHVSDPTPIVDLVNGKFYYSYYTNQWISSLSVSGADSELRTYAPDAPASGQTLTLKGSLDVTFPAGGIGFTNAAGTVHAPIKATTVDLSSLSTVSIAATGYDKGEYPLIAANGPISVPTAASVNIAVDEGYQAKLAQKTGDPNTLVVKIMRVITGADFTIDPKAFVYDASAHGPDVTASLGGVPLQRNTDFTVVNGEKTDVGSYSLQLQGTGDYTGITTGQTWKITAAIYTWKGQDNGDWNNPANWESTLGGYPDSTNKLARFTSDASVNVNVTGEIGGFDLEGRPVSVTLTGDGTINMPVAAWVELDNGQALHLVGERLTLLPISANHPIRAYNGSSLTVDGLTSWPFKVFYWVSKLVMNDCALTETTWENCSPMTGVTPVYATNSTVMVTSDFSNVKGMSLYLSGSTFGLTMSKSPSNDVALAHSTLALTNANLVAYKNVTIADGTSHFTATGDYAPASGGTWSFTVPADGYATAPIQAANVAIPTGHKLAIDLTAVNTAGTCPLATATGTLSIADELSGLKDNATLTLATGMKAELILTDDDKTLAVKLIRDLTVCTATVADIEYTGGDLTSGIQVTVTGTFGTESVTLVRGTDYDVAFTPDAIGQEDTTVACTATITGKGAYEGQLVRNFNILGLVFVWMGDGTASHNGSWTNAACWNRVGSGPGHGWPGDNCTSSSNAGKHTAQFDSGAANITMDIPSGVYKLNNPKIKHLVMADDADVSITMGEGGSGRVSVEENTPGVVTGILRIVGHLNNGTLFPFDLGGKNQVAYMPLVYNALHLTDVRQNPCESAFIFEKQGENSPLLTVTDSVINQGSYGNDFLCFECTNDTLAVRIAMTNSIWRSTCGKTDVVTVGRHATLSYCNATNLAGIVANYYQGSFTIDNSVVGYQNLHDTNAKTHGYVTGEEGDTFQATSLAISGANTKFALSEKATVTGNILFTMPAGGFANDEDWLYYNETGKTAFSIDTSFSGTAPLAVVGDLDLKDAKLTVNASAVAAAGTYPLVRVSTGTLTPPAAAMTVTGVADGFIGWVKTTEGGKGLDLVIESASLGDVTWTADHNYTNFWYTGRAGTYPTLIGTTPRGYVLKEGTDYEWQIRYGERGTKAKTDVLGVNSYYCRVEGKNAYAGETSLTNVPFQVVRQAYYWTNDSGVAAVGEWLAGVWEKGTLADVGNEGDRLDCPTGVATAFLKPDEGTVASVTLGGTAESPCEAYALLMSNVTSRTAWVRDGYLKLGAASGVDALASKCMIAFSNVTLTADSSVEMEMSACNTVLLFAGTNTLSSNIHLKFGASRSNKQLQFVNGATAVGDGITFRTADYNTICISNATVSMKNINPSSSITLGDLSFDFKLGDLNLHNDSETEFTPMLAVTNTFSFREAKKRDSSFLAAKIDARAKTTRGESFDILTVPTTTFDIYEPFNGMTPFAPATLAANTTCAAGLVPQIVVITNGELQTVRLVITEKVAPPTRTCAYAAHTGSAVANPMSPASDARIVYTVTDAAGQVVPIDSLSAAGAYSIVATPAAGYCWSDGTLTPLYFPFAIIDTTRYERIPFVRNNSGYVDTGIAIQRNVKADLSFFTTAPKTWAPLLAGYGGSSETMEYLLATRNNDLNLCATICGTEYACGINSGSGVSNRVVVALDAGTALTLVQEKGENAYTNQHAVGSLTACARTLYLFAKNYNGTPGDTSTDFGLYGATIYTNGTVTAREYLPFFDTESKQFGLYDIVTGAFKTSERAGYPLLGPSYDFSWVGPADAPTELGIWKDRNNWSYAGLGRGYAYPWLSHDVTYFTNGVAKVSIPTDATHAVGQFFDNADSDLTVVHDGAGTKMLEYPSGSPFAVRGKLNVVGTNESAMVSRFFNFGGSAVDTFPELYGTLYLRRLDHFPPDSAFKIAGDGAVLHIEDSALNQGQPAGKYKTLYNPDNVSFALAITNSTWLANYNETNVLGSATSVSVSNSDVKIGVAANASGRDFDIADSLVVFHNVNDPYYGDTAAMRSLTLAGNSKFALSGYAALTGTVTFIPPAGGFQRSQGDIFLEWGYTNGSYKAYCVTFDMRVAYSGVAPLAAEKGADLSQAAIIVDASQMTAEDAAAKGPYPLVRVDPTTGTLTAPASVVVTNVPAGYVGTVELVETAENKGYDLYLWRQADLPATPDLYYTGAEQEGVTNGAGYSVTGGTATQPGAYEATLSLNDGYHWWDASGTNKVVAWKILEYYAVTDSGLKPKVQWEWADAVGKLQTPPLDPGSGISTLLTSSNDFGFKYWEVYAFGFETNAAKAAAAVVQPVQGGDGTKLTLKLGDWPATPKADAGVTVTYKLMRSTTSPDSGHEQEGEAKSLPEFEADLTGWGTNVRYYHITPVFENK